MPGGVGEGPCSAGPGCCQETVLPEPRRVLGLGVEGLPGWASGSPTEPLSVLTRGPGLIFWEPLLDPCVAWSYPLQTSSCSLLGSLPSGLLQTPCSAPPPHPHPCNPAKSLLCSPCAPASEKSLPGAPSASHLRPKPGLPLLPPLTTLPLLSPDSEPEAPDPRGMLVTGSLQTPFIVHSPAPLPVLAHPPLPTLRAARGDSSDLGSIRRVSGRSWVLLSQLGPAKLRPPERCSPWARVSSLSRGCSLQHPFCRPPALIPPRLIGRTTQPELPGAPAVVSGPW